MDEPTRSRSTSILPWLLLVPSALLNVLVVGIVCLGIFGSRLSDRTSTGHDLNESTLVEATNGSRDKIAVIELNDIISGGDLESSLVADMKKQLKAAAEDEHVKAVVLRIDSPGGEVTASDEIYEAVKQVRDGAKKPVVVSMGSTAASGGYYIACGASWIVAHDTTFTGSIGVIMQSLNYRELMGKVGLEQIVFKSGAMKDMLSGSRELTPAERQYVQGMIMQTYDRFVGIVARERKLDEAALRAGPADGRVISGKDALTAKLVDATGDFDTACAKARELGNTPSAAIVRYAMPASWRDMFPLVGQARAQKVEVSLSPALPLPKLEAGRLYYLPSILAP